MKKFIVSVLFFGFAVGLTAQTDVSLKLNHKLGTEDFAYDVVATNNLGNTFKTTRLEYYVTQITIVHDGGSEIAVPLDVVALVQPGTETSTTIPLGSYAVTEIESVRFYIGVYEPVNTSDPSVYSMDHPLGPKSPSMHWGWAAGYRFLAYEGKTGADLTDNFQLHGLGNANYFEVAAPVDVVNVGGTLVMNLIGNYTEGLRDIDLTGGTISHGESGDAKKALENWRDHVFGNYYVGLAETDNELGWRIFPNPTTDGLLVVQFNEHTVNSVKTVQVRNSIGELIKVASSKNTQDLTIELENAGVYFVNALNAHGEIIATQRIVVQ